MTPWAVLLGTLQVRDTYAPYLGPCEEIVDKLTARRTHHERSPPLQNTGDVGDKGMLAIPVEYGEGGAWEGPPRIDWAAIEAANAGVHLPDDTDEDYTHRILFSRVRWRIIGSVFCGCLRSWRPPSCRSLGADACLRRRGVKRKTLERGAYSKAMIGVVRTEIRATITLVARGRSRHCSQLLVVDLSPWKSA